MAVVVSDATPLHYLILIGRDSVLQKLYGEVIVPPAVMKELAHEAAPQDMQDRSDSLPERKLLARRTEVNALCQRLARRAAWFQGRRSGRAGSGA